MVTGHVTTASLIQHGHDLLIGLSNCPATMLNLKIQPGSERQAFVHGGVNWHSLHEPVTNSRRVFPVRSLAQFNL